MWGGTRSIDVFDSATGNMTYYLWGPDGERGDVLIACELPREILDRHYRMCTENARINAPLARPWDTNLPVYVCRYALGTMADLWPEVRWFGTAPLVTRAVGAGE